MAFYGNPFNTNSSQTNNQNFENANGRQRNWSGPQGNGLPNFSPQFMGDHSNMLAPPRNMNMMNPPIGSPFGPQNMMSGLPPNMQSGPPLMLGFNQLNPPNNLEVNQELWVETKTDKGKYYYYNARTRETTWAKPESPNVKIISQDVIKTSTLNDLSSTCKKSPSRTASVANSANEAIKVKPEILANASVWSEHKNQNGVLYYFNAKTGKSVWQKPQALKDLETATLATSQGISPTPNTVGEKKHELATTTKAALSSEKQGNEVKQSKPTSSTVVPGTSWSVINTNTNRVFFYNSLTKSSVWEKPIELIGRLDVDKLVEDSPEETNQEDQPNNEQNPKVNKEEKPTSCFQISNSPWSVVWTSDGRVFFYDVITKKSVWERPHNLMGRSDVDELVKFPPDGKDSSTQQKSSNKRPASDELTVPNKKVKIEPVVLQKTKSNSVSEVEKCAAKERETVPYEQRVQTFKEMLKEKEVSTSSTWEKELRKIVFDPRYLLLISEERKQIFKEFVRERIVEKKREKDEKFRESKKAFKELLSESQLNGKSHFSDFSQKYAKEQRFKNVEKMRDRENLFDRYLVEIRQSEREEKRNRVEQVKEDFLALLREHKNINRHSHWSDVKTELKSDCRYEAVDSSEECKNLFEKYRQALKAEKKAKKDKKREEELGKKKKEHEEEDNNN